MRSPEDPDFSFVLQYRSLLVPIGIATAGQLDNPWLPTSEFEYRAPASET
jgi:hypothetical protein